MLKVYSDEYENAWDRFIETESMNGTFLQTRNFLNYHPADRFTDNSLMFMKGNNIIALIPANVVCDRSGRKLISHAGSTFGGIVLGKHYKKVDDAELIFQELEDYLKENNFTEIHLKMTSRLYAREESELLEYFLFLNGYKASSEMGYYINFDTYCKEEIQENFNSSRRRGYKNSLKHGLVFRELESEEEIRAFYSLLSDNMKKFDTVPVHTCEELLDLKNARLKEKIRFYGVCFGDNLVAGSAVFCFEKKVFHTQYLAGAQDFLQLYPSEFLYKNLIETAKNNGFCSISFGTSTLEHGTVLNGSLAKFKEGFGTREYVNRTYIKKLK